MNVEGSISLKTWLMHCGYMEGDVVVGPEGDVAMRAGVPDPVVDVGQVDPVLVLLGEAGKQKY